MEEEKVDRVKLTPTDFKEYKKRIVGIKDMSSHILVYSIISLQEQGMSLTEIVQQIFEYDGDIKEFLKEVKEDIGYDLLTVSKDEVLNNIPDKFKENCINIASLNKTEWKKQFDGVSSDVYNEFEALQKKMDDEILSICEEISKYDLSSIPPEMYCDFEELGQINFEGSGAKLDLTILDRNSKVEGSIKGCELIAYNGINYRAKSDSENPYIPQECLDKSQYSKVLEYYKNRWFPFQLDYLLKEPDIQIENQDFFDKQLDIYKDNIYKISDMWELMIPEVQKRNISYFDRILQDEEYSNYWQLALLHTAPDILRNKMSDILKKYEDENGKLYFRFFIEDVYYNCNTEIQIELFQELKSLIELKDENEAKEKLYKSLWENSNINTQEYYFPEMIQLCKKEDGKIDGNFLKELLTRRHYKLEIPEEYLHEIFEYYEKNEITDNNMQGIWRHIGEKNQEKYVIPFILRQNKREIPKEDILALWDNTAVNIRLQKYDEIVSVIEKQIPELAHEFKGKVYIDILKDLKEKDRNDIIEQNMPKFLNALREKYGGNKEADIAKDKNYDKNFSKVLFMLEEKGTFDNNNVNNIIDNLPILGEDTINRVYQSNSEMLAEYGNELIGAMATMRKKEAEELLNETENIFSQDKLPSFAKIYKFFELVVDNRNKILSSMSTNASATLNSTSSRKLSKRIIFSDLMKISMKSNNKSFMRFIETLENGNKTYEKLMKNNGDVDKLDVQEKSDLKSYIKTLYFLYEESAASRIDKKEGKKIRLTGDIGKDAENLGKRYSKTGKIFDLPDRIIKGFIGPYQELFDGIDTIEKMKNYMQTEVQNSNEKHRVLAKQKINLQTGDMIKGIQGDLFPKIFPSIISEGVRAGEFLGISNHTDATPLDADFSVILGSNNGKNLSEKISKTMSSGYGNTFIVIKYDPNKIEFTRKDDNLDVENNGQNSSERISQRKEKNEIKQRIVNRANSEYIPSKLEAFNSFQGTEHYGIRTGVGITDIDYIVTSCYDKRMAYELAMNGTYIPIVDKQTEELLFTPEQYDNIRAQMKGLSYYKTDEFEIEKSAFSGKAKEIVDKIFPNGNVEESISERDAKVKRGAIQRSVKKAVYESMKLGISYSITGDLTDGFIEFVDTGSTGRGTNLPGDGDFDFTLKIDRSILETPEKLQKLKTALRQELTKGESENETSFEELNGNFRYKKVNVEGLKQPVDIDITFMGKDEHIQYSTDMSVRDRLKNLKESNLEGYKYTIGNIVLAKTMLKEKGLYKKSTSPGATNYGGFGGVGVENWILQNGGSFAKAIETFLEASEKAKDFSEFKEIYPIFDFGQNHMAKEYSHDSFIRGLTDSGYIEMKSELKKIRDVLTPIKQQNQISEDFLKGAESISMERRMGSLMEITGELKAEKRKENEKSEDSIGLVPEQ